MNFDLCWDPYHDWEKFVGWGHTYIHDRKLMNICTVSQSPTDYQLRVVCPINSVKKKVLTSGYKLEIVQPLWICRLG